MIGSISQTGRDPVDIHIGAKVREARSKLEMSAATLALAIGASEHDVEDFEEGRRRIGAANLCGLCRALDQQISYFFDGYTTSSDAGDNDLTIRVSRLVRTFMDLSADQQEEAYNLIQGLAVGTGAD